MSEFGAIDAGWAADALRSIMSSGTNPSSADFGNAGLLGALEWGNRQQRERRSQELQNELESRERMKRMEVEANALNLATGREQDWAKLLAELMNKRWMIGQGRQQKREELGSQERQRQILADAATKRQNMTGQQRLMEILQRAQARPQKVDTNSAAYLMRKNQIRKENKALAPAEVERMAYEEMDRRLNPLRYNDGGANLMQQMSVPVESGAANLGPRADAGESGDYSALADLLAMYGQA